MRVSAPLVFTCFVAACASFPELDATVPTHLDNAGYPRLVPVEPLIRASETTQITPEMTSAVLGRVAALRARAARLRRPIVDRPTRARMRAGVTGIIQN